MVRSVNTEYADINPALLIPAYNAAATLGDVLVSVGDTFSTILVIDDGSRDATAAVARDAGVEVIGHEHNRGKGAALRTGFNVLLERGFSVIMTMDADGQHSPANIAAFLELLKNLTTRDGKRWGLIIGDRFWNRADIPSYRYWPNRVGQLFLSWLTGQEIHDTQCGFRLYNAEALKAVTLERDRFELETEVILAVARKGYSIHFVPITVIYPENEFRKSNFRPIVDTFHISIVVLRFMIGRFTARLMTLLKSAFR